MEVLLNSLLDQGAMGIAFAVILFLFWYFYKKQFNNLWQNLMRKDVELAELNERVLQAFERNTSAFEKFVGVISRLEESNKRIENKVDKIYLKINGKKKA